MNYDTPQDGQRQDSGIFISRTRMQSALAYGVILVVALVAIAWFNASHPATPAADWHPAPDPPSVDNSVHVNILSGNKFFSDNQTCIGACK